MRNGDGDEMIVNTVTVALEGQGCNKFLFNEQYRSMEITFLLES